MTEVRTKEAKQDHRSVCKASARHIYACALAQVSAKAKANMGLVLSSTEGQRECTAHQERGRYRMCGLGASHYHPQGS